MTDTKLTSAEKMVRADLLALLDGIEVAHNTLTTVVYRAGVSTVEFSLAVMSENESKFRRKVGEYYALTRFENGQTVKMHRDDFHDFYHMMLFRTQEDRNPF